MRMLTGDDLIDAYNLQASEIIHTIAGHPPRENTYKSPFKKKRPTKAVEIEKWFPIGSKGRDVKPVRMVAQQIKTVDFTGGVDLDLNHKSSRSAITMQHTDKFSRKISPLLATGAIVRNDPPIFQLNKDLSFDDPSRNTTFNDGIYELNIANTVRHLGMRSNSMLTPS